jgi:thymidylate synthase
MLKIAPQFANFMDGGTFHGAYGPRIRQQMPLVIERLRKDPDTRQAVVTIWDPAKDLLEDGLHDYPCTLGFQFVIRNGRLSMITTMRSNDVWWGLAHDIFQFTQLQMTVANVLGIPYGTYYHRSNSLHAYERDFADIARMRRTTATPFKVLRIPEGLKGDSWEEVRRTAELLISGASSEVYPESWYVEALGL